MRLSCNLWGYDIGLAIRNMKQVDVEGYTNRCKDGFYIVTLDYDNLEPDWIINEIKRLQKDFNLGEFLLFKSNKGVHAVCNDKVTLKEFTEIAMNSSMDQFHFSVPLLYGKRIWTLRYSEKDGKRPKFFAKVDGESTRVRSNAHVQLLEFLFDMPFSHEGCDGFHIDDVIMARYKI